MTDCYIYDAVRTPRGKGRANGSLHEVTALELATQVLESVRDRNELDTSAVDDVVLGCVSPVKEQGSDIARIAALNADYDDSVSGVQINRFSIVARPGEVRLRRDDPRSLLPAQAVQSRTDPRS